MCSTMGRWQFNSKGHAKLKTMRNAGVFCMLVLDTVGAKEYRGDTCDTIHYIHVSNSQKKKIIFISMVFLLKKTQIVTKK